MARTGFAAIPDAERYWLRHATVPVCLIDDDREWTSDREGLARVDLLISGGRIAQIVPANARKSTSAETEPNAECDLRGAMVWPGFVDMHTHLDKGHIWPRSPNPDGTFAQALQAVERDRRASWVAEDLRARMEFALRCAHVHGTTAIRTHLDSATPHHRTTWPLFAEVRDEWRERIELQASSIVGIDEIGGDFGADLAATVGRHGGVLGVVTYMVPDMAAAIARLFDLALGHGLDLDLHVDETGDPDAVSLRMVAEEALARKFDGRVVVGHCCSLARQSEDTAARTLDLVAEANFAVVSLPMCNLYLQDRESARTPRWRGVTLLHEMRARNIPVAVASDNTRDPFYAYGDLDLLEVFREAVRIVHFDHPIAAWPCAITRWPADIIGLDDRGRIGHGQPADLVVCRGRNFSEVLSRPEADRTVLRAGRPIDRRLPDYSELDEWMGANR